jgi:putative ABC transport system permease protein
VEIVGVVKDSKYNDLRDEVPPTLFLPVSQRDLGPRLTFELRAAHGISASSLIPGVKVAMAEQDSRVDLEFHTLEVQLAESLNRERLLATLSGFFGGLALLLAAIGLYGVMSYSVARRRNEIGIRMALGAEQARVMRMVLGEVALLIAIGSIVGIGAALASTKLIATFLFGVQPHDATTLTVSAALLASIAILAGYLPARRASKLDPMVALREE